LGIAKDWEGTAMSSATLDDQAFLADALAEIQRINALDEVWTNYLAQHTTIPQDDVESIIKIAEKLDHGLTTCAQIAERFESIISANQDRVQEAVETLLNDVMITDETREYLRNSSERAGGFYPLSVKAMNAVKELTPMAKQEIALKVQKIRDGQPLAGDLPPRWRCGIKIGTTIVFGVAATVWTGGLGAVFLWGVAGYHAGAAGKYCGTYNVLW
jgi:hypothetical protein